MPNATLDALAQQVAKNIDAENSAVQVLNGVAGRIQTAVDAALANGATAEELKPVTDEVAALKTSADNLAAAIVSATPAA
jgi:alkylhydroperoxidase/carboxymuconolactone decarboxylase family protein YurZ